MELSGLDPYSDEIIASPKPFFEALRKECPVFRDERAGVTWISRYEDVRAAARRPEVFSNHRPAFGAGDSELEAIRAEGYPEVHTITQTDPPEHTRYRKLVFRAFSPEAVKRLEPSIRRICNGFIDNFIHRGEVEFVSEFALLVPGMVMADALGVPFADQDRFTQWADEIIPTIMLPEGLSRDKQIEYTRSWVEFQHYFAKLVEQKRANPGTDMISDLIVARVEGERQLDLPEILDLIRLFLVAGNETSASWIAGTMLLLLDNPTVMQRVVADRRLIPQMLEESLRLVTPSRWNRRTLEGDRNMVMRGTEIQMGDVVRLVWNSANYDEERFPNPNVFDIDRDTSGHLAFGHGIHFCIGKDLARAEGRIAYEVLFDRLGNIELALPREDVRNLPMAGVNRLNHLPLRFRPNVVRAHPRRPRRT